MRDLLRQQSDYVWENEENLSEVEKIQAQIAVIDRSLQIGTDWDDKRQRIDRLNRLKHRLCVCREEMDELRAVGLPNIEIFYQGTLEQVQEKIPNIFKPYLFLVDCHYYFPQASIDNWNKDFPSSDWYIAGMNYIDHPMKATIWKGEAELTVRNTTKGTMEVCYKPRANKEYCHPLRNVSLTKATCLQDIPVESMHGGMETVRFFAI